MPRKKKEPLKEFKLKFTGKMTILIELEEYGPLQYRIDDMDTVMDVTRIILDKTDNTTTVNSYNKRDEHTFKKLLDF
jgi:hypothetical protein